MKSRFLIAAALLVIASSCRKANPDIPTSIPDTLYGTYWLGATSTAKWEILFPEEKTGDKLCYIITTMVDTGQEKLSKYSYTYTKPILRLSPYPPSEDFPGFSATVSLSSQGLAMTLDGSQAGWTNPIVLFYTKPDSLEQTRAGLLR